jgi:hypothetical protein
MRLAFLPGAAALLTSLGCINTDPSIFVDVQVSSPSFAVQPVALGATVTGGFTMSLHLGARAAGSSEVNVQGFELVSEDESAILVPSLPLAAEGATFPVVIEPDTDVVIDLVVDYGGDTITAAEQQTLCDAGTVRYRGSITDSLRGTTVPVLSEPVAVLGCGAAP